MLSIINLVFLFLFGVEPLAKYFSKKYFFDKLNAANHRQTKRSEATLLSVREVAGYASNFVSSNDLFTPP
jgi:NADH:ubiquinone oxidoreductase subunit 5 (subunit L)/multisubunit Na+/H+ antiporter MnhA subunit